ncbi:MAG: hypothetical protein JSS86_06300 [Cyanobacteria bacterium SZAS LIN-2]|nr:hypothetical protein [Cyanobacteria bacterium SZAS LIN-2]
MGSKNATKTGSTFPVAAMFFIAVIAAVVSGASFEVIKHWPLPVSVVPYFGWKTGGLWGLIVGAISGLVLGWVTDDSHFDQQS